MSKLALVGGNEFMIEDGVDAFIASQTQSTIGVIPFASDNYLNPFHWAQEKYRSLGKETILIDNPESPLPNTISTVYLVGGHPDSLHKALFSSVLWNDIERKWREESLLVCGSSAGAMVVFPKMMAHGSRMHGGTEVTPGLGLLPDGILVPHWNSANANWKESFTQKYQNELIITVDENTSLFINDTLATVVGVGHVELFNKQHKKYSQQETFIF